MRAARIVLQLALALVERCVPQQQYQQEVTQNQQLLYLNATYQQLNQNLQSEVAADQVQIKQLQNRLQVTMVNAILFPEGSWELHEQGRRELSKVVPALQAVTNKQIVSEGYTDNTADRRTASGPFPTNWDVSAARAVSMVRYLEPQGIDPNQLSAVTLVSITQSHRTTFPTGMHKITASTSSSRTRPPCSNFTAT